MSRRPLAMLLASLLTACGGRGAAGTPEPTASGTSIPAPVATTLTPRPTLVVTATPTPAPTGRPRVTRVTGVGDTITVTFSRAMLQIGEGSGFEMAGNYLLDGRALPLATNLGCLTRECLIVGIELPEGTLVPGVGRVRVVEARDQEAAADRADELFARRRAAGHREVAGVPARRVAERIGGVPGGARAHGLRRSAVVHRPTCDPILDQRHLALERSFDVERDPQGPGIVRVVPEGEVIAGNSVVDSTGHERAALLHGLRAEAGDRDDPQDLGDCQFLEDRFVVARRELPAVAGEGAFLGSPRGHPLGKERVCPHREGFGVGRAGVGVALHQTSEVRQRGRGVCRDAARVDDSILGDLDLRSAGGAHRARQGGADLPDRLRLRQSIGARGLLVEAGAGRDRLPGGG